MPACGLWLMYHQLKHIFNGEYIFQNVFKKEHTFSHASIKKRFAQNWDLYSNKIKVYATDRRGEHGCVLVRGMLSIQIITEIRRFS